MSKMDDMRAMREARYEANRSSARKAAESAKAPPQVPQEAPKAEVVPESAQDDLCGHRAISGRTCTREKGHEAKSHRYA